MSEQLPTLDSAGLGRWAWRQFTSMRTALVLLFMLALASIPGSVLPQRGSDSLAVQAWMNEHGVVGTVLDQLGFFDVFASPWFAAVYLLLFISLVGCVIPRIHQLWRAWRAVPPPAPRRLGRLPGTITTTGVDATASLDEVAAFLSGHRWRVRRGSDESGTWVAAEKGYLSQAGNLAFHVSLVLILVAVAVGGLFGWKGSIIVREGEGFSDTITQYDSWTGGRFVSPLDLPPFSFTLEAFNVEFERSDSQRGAPRAFDAQVSYRLDPAAQPQQARVDVNEPLVVGDAKVFLVGHGYAPHLRLTDSTGAVVFDDSVVFLPQDGNFTSTGVLKAPDATPSIGIQGVFFPTVGVSPDGGTMSTFPAPDDPAVVLAAWQGDLGLDDGVPQSVYTLRTEGLDKLGVGALRPGQSWQIPGGAGTVDFTGFDRWASFQIAHDPGKEWALLASVFAMLGLVISVVVQRRRLWVKALLAPDQAGNTVFEIAGMTRASTLDEAPVGALVEDLDRVQRLIEVRERT